jgi:hypothetical protein
MKNLVAIGLACCLPMGLAAEDPSESTADLGMVNVLVIEDSAILAKDVLCGRADECVTVHRAVLTARLQKVSTLRERGRWI